MTSNSSKADVGGQSSSGGVVLHGYHKKLKTMKKKYFVLYEDCGKTEARLEYFDNDKKFKSKSNPKRTIILSSCFNINRSLDTKHEFVITLSTKDGGFGIVMDTEEDMNKWLRAMLKLQSGQHVFAGEPRPYYEHVWQVVVQRKGLAEKKGILGSYHVCLSSKSVTLIRIGLDRTNIGEARTQLIEFNLTSIRRCGDSKCYFYMEVGRHSVTGAGELWMETKDSLIAQNMHTMILNVMSSNADDPYGPMRKRSSSATETSKPVTILQRRQTHSGSKTMNSSSPVSVLNRDRCDSLPSSRNRTTTESSGYNAFTNTSMPPSRTMSSLSTVPNSVYNRHSHSPPMNSNALSPSVVCSESDGSTLSIDETDSMLNSLNTEESASFVSRFFNSRSPGGVIPEEMTDEFCWYSDQKKQNCIENAPAMEKLYSNSGANLKNKKTPFTRSDLLSEETESQYMDMCNSISPSETVHGIGAEFPFKSCNDSSGGNSRASSLAEEIVDGYVHMSPQTSDYVDMEQSLKSRRQNYNLWQLGKPLKEMCFAEFPLEKVSSRILPDEDELQHLNERPPRAYSVGSRMEHNNQKLRIEVITNTDQNNCRVRAFSVGSRSKVPRCDLQRNILMAANSCSSNNSNINTSKTSIASIEPTSESAVRGRKSSSAPLLIHKSQNSVDRMDDLMEIDFSKNSGSRSNSLSSQSPATSSYLKNLPKASHLRSSTLSTSPRQNALHNRSHDSFSESTNEDNGYLEMRPVIYSHSLGSHDESTDHKLVPNEIANSDISDTRLPHQHQQQQDPTHNKLKVVDWTKVETPEGYLEMSWNGNKDNSSSDIHISNNNNISAKSRTPTTPMDIKKSRGVTKMPSINNRTLATTNHSMFSILHTQNQATQFNINSAINKPDTSQRKRFFDHVNSSFTISEEKIQPDPDATIAEKFNNLNLELSSRKNTDDLSNVHVELELSTADTDCYDYTKYCARKLKQMPSRKEDAISREHNGGGGDVPSSQNVESLDTNNTLNVNKSSKLISSNQAGVNKRSRISNSPKWTPTSPYLSTGNSRRSSNTNRHTKGTGTGYELLHISSDSSLQTRKNISRPSSVNSDSNFSPEATPDLLQSNSVSASTATLCFSPKNCDNRIQDGILKVKPLPITSNIEQCNGPDNECHQYMQMGSATPFSELHYASLDLPISSTKNSNTKMYDPLTNQTRTSTSDDTSTSLSPNSNTSQKSAFTYAKIDFNQCGDNKKLKCGTQNNL